MFDEYNFMNNTVYDIFFGFSESEVQKLCEKYTGRLTLDDLKRWYDGYYLSDGSSLFNPRSVVKALSQGVREKDYAAKAREYTEEVLLAGISYDKAEKKHRCIIERISS